MKKIPTYAEIREENYKYNWSDYISDKFELDLNNWRSSPYTYLKAKYYAECSIFITYIFLHLGINANTTTFLYIAFGLLGSICIATDYLPLIFLGAFFIFNKGVFDWADGQVARFKNQQTLVGHLLDAYGARVNSIFFYCGLGLYSYNQNSDVVFLYFVILYCLFNSILISVYSSDLLLREITNNEINVIKTKTKSKAQEALSNLSKTNFGNLINRFKFLYYIFDDRARNVDLILLIIFIEQLYLDIFITPYIFILVSVKSFLIYIVDFYIFFTGNWVKKFKKM